LKPAFTHCALHVQDLEQSVVFYRDYCGLKVVDEHGQGPNDHAIWMSEEGRERDYVFVLLLGGKKHEQPREDLSHFGFALASRAEVDVIAERGRVAGCLAWEPKDFPYPVGYRCALRDPDGYVIEFSYGQPLGPSA
jgi:catechol 2,3-dioxygenase-like lactoylglutathione lyase family enzyme